MTATFLFGDSFDLYSTEAEMIANHWTSQPGGSLSATNRYGTGKSMSFSNAGNGVFKSLGSNYGSLLIMGDFQRTVGTSATPIIIGIRESGTAHMELRHDGTTGQLFATRNGTEIARTTYALGNTVWYHVQFRVTCDSSAGTVDIYVDGQSKLSASSLNTRNGGTGVFNEVYFTLTGASNSCLWDNVAIFSTTSTADMLTDVPRYYLSSPVSEGFTQNFAPSTGTDNALTIDEVPNNGDTDYNSSSTLNDLDLLNMSDLSITTGTILAVQSRVFARREDSGTRTIAPIFRINSTNYVQTSSVISNTYTWCDSVNVTNPDTSAAWTIADINGLQAGYKITL